MNIIQKLHSVTKKFFAEVLLDDLARGRIDIKNLPPEMRRFVITCLISLCAVLACTVILYFYDGSLPTISFSCFDITYNISYITLIISFMAFITGWIFLLIGGVTSNTITFSILALFFIFLIGYIGLDSSYPWWLFLPLGFITVLLIPSLRHSRYIPPALRYIILYALCLRIAYLYILATPIKHYINNKYLWPAISGLAILLSFLSSLLSYLKKYRFPEKLFVIIGLLAVFMGIFLRGTFQITKLIEALFMVFRQITIYISLFWFILGFSALWGVINLAEWARDSLEILFPKKIIFGIVFIFWIAIFLLKLLLPNPPLIWNFSLTWTAWSIAGSIVLLYKRFNITRILTLFQLTIFTLLLTHAYYVIQFETVEEMKFQLGSLAIFIIGITWLLFQGSGFIINSSGKWFPRNSRLLLFFGLIFLMLGLNHLMLIARDVDFINIVKISAFTGFLYTGPPFILYLLLVKRLKRHPVNLRELAYLFIWGAILIHPGLILRKALYNYGIPIVSLAVIFSIIQEYLNVIVIKKITYRSSSFNEIIDGIIYAGAIGLGWLIFELNPQFSLIPVQIRFVEDINKLVLLTSSSLWYLFSLQFACAGLLGYGLAKTKLSGKSWGRPLFIGLILAVLYRSINSIILAIYLKQLFRSGLIWGLTVISLLVAFITIRKALRSTSP